MKKFLLLCLLSGCALTGAHQKEAEKQAAEWAKQMGMEDAKVSCVRDDSDGDGYVSCTVASGGQMHSVECTGAWTINDGCRVPKFQVKGGQ